MNFNFNGSSTAVPVDRPLEMLLAAFAAGSLESAFAALIGAHLELRGENRDFVSSLEMAGGIMLEDSEPLPLSERDRRLNAILSGGSDSGVQVPTAEHSAPHPAPLAADGDELLPPALRAYVGRDFEALSWSEMAPGLRHCVIASQNGVEASFVRCRAGKRLLRREYGSQQLSGLEMILVLQGGFGDAHGHYLRGAIAVADEAADQRIVVDPNEEAIFFLVRDSRKR